MTFRRGDNNKTMLVVVRCTPAEKAQSGALALEAGLSLSAFFRKRALGLPVHSKADQTTINELRRLGGLVKHIHIETNGAYSKETSGVLVALMDAIKRIGTV